MRAPSSPLSLLLALAALLGCVEAPPTCGPESCSGCCDELGQCLTGQSSREACGGGGEACAVCGEGARCLQGRCEPAGPEDAGTPLASEDAGEDAGGDAGLDAGADAGRPDAGGCTGCAGCCHNGQCLSVTQQTRLACGSGGVACVGCPDYSRCENGACVACGAPGCLGCCERSGACNQAPGPASCGSDGGRCAACAGGDACLSRDGGALSCGPPPAGVVGSSCDGDAGPCLVGGCRTSTATGAYPYPGGYCTYACTTPQCAEDGRCIAFSSSHYIGESGQFCMKSCSGESDCRPGYLCAGTLPDGGGTVCLLDPPSPDGQTGRVCLHAADCKNPPRKGICDVETGGPQGSYFYCTADCSGWRGDAYCGDGGACVETYGGRRCMKRCAGVGQGQGSCPPTMVCIGLPLADGGADPIDGVCVAHCANFNRGCDAGMICSDAGYCEP